MRRIQGVVGATLLYGSNDPTPDLLPVMQFLVDDLRAEGQKIASLRLGSRSLRLRTAGFDIALTQASGPMPSEATTCVRRLSSDTPDVARARMVRNLREHRHAMGFILRQRRATADGAPPLAQTLSDLGRRCLLPVFEAAQPCLVIWQPGGLLFSTAEFLSLKDDALLSLPERENLTVIQAGPRRQTPRPITLVRPARPATETRAERATGQSAGRLFGTPQPDRPRVLPRLDVHETRLSAAFRQTASRPSESVTPLGPRIRRVVAAALWGLLLPQLLSGWLPI
ncbi:hypothetical protein [Pararhodobacter sp.]|uniref:hypothetical protein n=1 Tax=Pararhodobacter sp. TaxID=2127056 RepID=UPI002AFE81D1|nr:hypothetical protein [Pararhodobacter sp.]